MTERLTQIEEAYAVVNGARVHYQRAGTGRPLLLLHGLVGSAKNWRQNISFLSRDSNVYALDQATGKEKWRFNNSGSWVNSTPAVMSFPTLMRSASLPARGNVISMPMP